jgi:hypothetical protein
MLTQLTYPLTITPTVAFPFKCTATATGATTITITITATAPGFDGRSKGVSLNSGAAPWPCLEQLPLFVLRLVRHPQVLVRLARGDSTARRAAEVALLQ